MAIVFLFVAVAAIAIGIRGQSSAAGSLLASEFTGANSFIEWLAAIVMLGALGFIRPIRPAANAMLGLVILAMFIRKGQGFFSEINQALTSATATPRPAAPAAPANPANAPGGSNTAAGAAAPPPIAPQGGIQNWWPDIAIPSLPSAVITENFL